MVTCSRISCTIEEDVAICRCIEECKIAVNMCISTQIIILKTCICIFTASFIVRCLVISPWQGKYFYIA